MMLKRFLGLFEPKLQKRPETFSLGNRPEEPLPGIGVEQPSPVTPEEAGLTPAQVALARLREDYEATRSLLQELTGYDPKDVDAIRRECVHLGQLIGKLEADAAEAQPQGDISARIDDNLGRVKDVFHVPRNSDVIIREFELGLAPPVRAFLLYIEGLADKEIISWAILQPLMLLATLGKLPAGKEPSKIIRENLVPGHQVEIKYSFMDAIDAVLTGVSALFIDGQPYAVLIETKKWEHRSVERASVERVVYGPQQAFNEISRTNSALVRRKLRSPDLVMEALKVGRRSESELFLMYVEGLTNPRLVDEVRRRIQAIDVDYLPESGMLEQYIETSPISLFPQSLPTERPDRVAAFLSEGHIALVVDDNPFALIVPATFTSFFHSAEDYYLRWPFGSFIRAFRLAGMLFALYLPALYIAITNFHPEMIPTDLLLAVAASREPVPFPIPVEVLFMELSLEIIREAGIRMPSTIGPTLGIIGALILGQAAVAAGIVSPILVIIVAITGLGSFLIPNYSATFTIRILRFLMIFLASAFGMFGLAVGTYALIIHMAALQTYGVPFLSPIAPFRPGTPDIGVRGPLYKMEKRPSFLRPLDRIRQAPLTRKWAPGGPVEKRKQQAQYEEERE